MNIRGKWTHAAALGFACTVGFSVPGKADVAIGVLSPLSGKGAAYGQQQQHAI